MQSPTPWLTPSRTRTNRKLRLFCLPSAGGGASIYRGWQPAFDNDIQVCPIQLPGRETRIGEACIRSVPTLAEIMTSALEPWLAEMPFAIFGHSMGALVAFEWVRLLRKRKLRMPIALYVSGRAAPDDARESTLLRDLRSLPDDLFLKQLQRLYAGIPAELEQSPEVMEYYLPILRADVELIETYEYVPQPPLLLPIHAFAGIDDPSLRLTDLIAWQSHTAGPFGVKIYPGGHFFDQTPLRKFLAAHLRSSHELASNAQFRVAAF